MSPPLIIIVTLIYLGVAVSEYSNGRKGLAIMFVGYALANIGLIVETVK